MDQRRSHLLTGKAILRSALPNMGQAIKADQCVKEILQVVPVVVVRDGCNEIVDTRKGDPASSADTLGRLRGSNQPGCEGGVIRASKRRPWTMSRNADPDRR
jgi:hypothetical protein